LPLKDLGAAESRSGEANIKVGKADLHIIDDDVVELEEGRPTRSEGTPKQVE